MANNTGNPLGSDAYPDFQDNVRNLDYLVAGEAPSYPDRFGKNRKSWAGMEREFSSSQEQRNDTFNQLMINTQFEWPPILFKEGSTLEVSRPTQLISYEGQLYSVRLPATFPVVLSGIWDVAVASLTPREDASLRQQLISKGGAGLVEFSDSSAYPPGTAGNAIAERPTISETTQLVSAHNRSISAHPELRAGIEADADRAEAARDAAQLSAGVFQDVASGLANTPVDKFFNVISPEASQFMILYQNNAGVAKEIARYPSANAVASVSAKSDSNSEMLSRLTGASITLDIPCEPGSINSATGAAQAAGTRVRSSAAMYMRAGDAVSSRAGFQFSIFYYASADYSQFISADGAWHSEDTVRRDGYLRFVSRRTDDSAVIVSEREINWLSFTYSAQKIREEAIPPVSGTLVKPGTLPYSALQTAALIESTPIVQGSINSATGAEQSNSQAARTGFIKVSKGDSLALTDANYLYSPFWYSSQSVAGFVSADGKWHTDTMRSPLDGYVRVTTKRVDEKPVGLPNMTWVTFSSPAGPLITGSGQIADSVVDVNNLTPEVLSLIGNESAARWDGKVWLTLGDSITARLWYQPIVAPMLRLSYVGYGLSGSTLARKTPSDTTAMCTRFSSMQATGDLITVWGGVNDFGFSYGSMGGTDLGVMGDTGLDTVYGALDTIISGLLGKYPGKKLAFFITTPVSDAMGMRKKNAKGFYLWEYCDAVRKMCEWYSVPYLDLYKLSGINNLNTNIFTLNADETIADGLHPNKRAFEFMKYRMAEFLRNV